MLILSRIYIKCLIFASQTRFLGKFLLLTCVNRYKIDIAYFTTIQHTKIWYVEQFVITSHYVYYVYCVIMFHITIKNFHVEQNEITFHCSWSSHILLHGECPQQIWCIVRQHCDENFQQGMWKEQPREGFCHIPHLLWPWAHPRTGLKQFEKHRCKFGSWKISTKLHILWPRAHPGTCLQSMNYNHQHTCLAIITLDYCCSNHQATAAENEIFDPNQSQTIIMSYHPW